MAFRNILRKSRTLLVVFALGMSIALIVSVYSGIDATNANTTDMINKTNANTQAMIDNATLSTQQLVANVNASTQQMIDTANSNTQASVNKTISSTQSTLDNVTSSTNASINTTISSTQSTIDNVTSSTNASINRTISDTQAMLDSANSSTQQDLVNKTILSTQAAIDKVNATTQEMINQTVAQAQASINKTMADTQATVALAEQSFNETANNTQIQMTKITVANSTRQSGFPSGGPGGGMSFSPFQSYSAISGDIIADMSLIEGVQDIVSRVEKTYGTQTNITMNPPSGNGSFNQTPGGSRPTRPGQGGTITRFTSDYTIEGVPLNDTLNEKYHILPSIIINGTTLNEIDNSSVLIHKDQVTYFNASVGDTITIGGTNFTVKGIYYTSLQNTSVYMSIDAARSLLNMSESDANVLDVYTINASVVDNVSSDISYYYSNFTVTPYKDSFTSSAEYTQRVQSMQIERMKSDAENQIQRLEADMYNQTAQLNASAANQIAQLEAARDKQVSVLSLDAANMTKALTEDRDNQIAQLTSDAENQTKQLEAAGDNQTAQLTSDAENQTKQLEAARDNQIVQLKESLVNQTAQFKADQNKQVNQYELDLAKQVAQSNADQSKQVSQLEGDKLVLETIGSLIGIISAVTASMIVLFMMFYTVKERTREIGVYKALGFTRSNITAQFVIEGTVIGFLGGLAGIIIAIVAGPTLSGALIRSAEFQVSLPTLQTTLVALGLTMLLGAFGSLYPAWSASKKSAVEDLGYE